MKEGLGFKLFCEAAEIFLYSEEELRELLQPQEVEEIIKLRNEVLAESMANKNITIEFDDTDSIPLAAEDPAEFNANPGDNEQ